MISSGIYSSIYTEDGEESLQGYSFRVSDFANPV